MARALILALALSLIACGSESTDQATLEAAEPVTDWRLLIQLPDVELPVRPLITTL